MKKYCFILGIFFLLSFKIVSGISGKYNVILDSNFKNHGSKYVIIINDNKYTKEFPNSEKVEGGIEVVEGRNSKKIYYLKDFLFVQQKVIIDSLKLHTLGKVIMEVEEINADTLLFRTTYDRQLNVTINTGKFIRVN
jgi:hypothetical protein